jgi:methylase of polypeptide subunit release factors
MDARDEALFALGEKLRGEGYQFTAITPASHRIVTDRPFELPTTLHSIFGWSRPFRQNAFTRRIIALLERAEELETGHGWFRSKVRFSTIDDRLFVHSAFPTLSRDAVFFGPDTYRFARAVRLALANMEVAAPFTIIDIGCGSGAGGLLAAMQLLPQRAEIVLSDVNETALRFSRINAALNGLPGARIVSSDIFERIEGLGNMIISNPPYLVDEAERLYCHGGGELGLALSLRIAEESIGRLASGGRLVLYTGTPIIAGTDTFFEALRPVLQARNCSYSYEEIDPDVFGEELDSPPYDRADRIAVVVLTVTN